MPQEAPALNHDKETMTKQQSSSSEHTRNREVQEDTQMASIPQEERSRSYLFQTSKRKRQEQDDSEHRTKMLKAMLAMIRETSTGEDIQHAYVTFIPRKSRDHKYITQAFHTIMDGQGDDEDKESSFKEHASSAVEVNGIKIPQTFKQAINDKDHEKRWQKALEEEINQLVRNGTWEEFILPDGANLVDTKRVFAIKLNTDGSLERYGVLLPLHLHFALTSA